MVEQDVKCTQGKSDWKFIKNVKNSVNIPVLVNGDINNDNDLDLAINQSNADGVMIGRGSYGKPWIFEELRSKQNLMRKKLIEIKKKKLF